jgi:hypothetical protein
MIRVEASTIVERRAEAVWAYVSNLDNLKEWDPGVVDVSWQRPLEMGSSFTITANVAGSRVGDGRISAFEPNRTFAWETRVRAPGWVTGGGRSWVRGTYTTEPIEGDRTRLTRLFEGEGLGLLRLVEPLIGWYGRREQMAEISNIKRVLESRAPTDASPQ